MNFIKIFFLLGALLLISCKKGNSAEDEAFVQDVIKYYAAQTSFSADIEYKIKGIAKTDTLTIKTQYKIIRDKKDTVFGGLIWYNVDIDTVFKNIEKYYDGDKIYLIEKDSGNVTRYDAKKGQTFVIEDNRDSQIKKVYFLDIEDLKQTLANDSIGNNIKDTLYNNRKYTLLTLKYPDNEDSTNHTKKIFINKENKHIEKITYYCKSYDDFQYTEWNISNIQFNTVKREDLSRHFNKLTANYAFIDFIPYSERKMSPVKILMHAPDFTAKSFKDNEEVHLSDYKNKIVVLDFWHMSCPPCAMAIPHLTRIQKKYKTEVVVLGVNPYDDNKKDADKIAMFKKRTGLDYEIAMIDSNITKKYNVTGFPTVFIIDKNGVIKHTEPGFSTDLEDNLDKVIKNLR